MGWGRALGGAAVSLFAISCTAAAETPKSSEAAAHWVSDPRTGCYVFDADSAPADSVTWTGDCLERTASGPGTAIFSQAGRPVLWISGRFVKGGASGFVGANWFDGAHYDGAAAAGRLSGHGKLTRRDGSIVEADFVDGQPRSNNLAPSASAPPANSASPSTLAVADSWVRGLAGKTLVAADTGTLSFSFAGSRIVQERTLAGGSPQQTYLTFLNPMQGTVSDGRDSAQISGMFSVNAATLTIQYADGRSESWTPLAGDGVSLVSSVTGQLAQCTSWYPQGHVFSVAERQAAVAAYAVRLGVSSAAQPTCPGASAVLQAEVPKTNAESPPSAPSKPHPQTTTHKTASSLPDADAQPLFVRVSEVHAIDDAAPPATANEEPRASRVADVVAASPAKPSECLSIEADGSAWGFRNHCGFAVQFAYCLKEIAGADNSCDSGAVAGGVPANAFDPLFVEASLSGGGHKFRWISCAGGNGEVVPRLLRSDPPAGQCVHGRT